MQLPYVLNFQNSFGDYVLESDWWHSTSLLEEVFMAFLTWHGNVIVLRPFFFSSRFFQIFFLWYAVWCCVGMLSATAALGLILLWDVDGGLSSIDKYLYSNKDHIKVWILNCRHATWIWTHGYHSFVTLCIELCCLVSVV